METYGKSQSPQSNGVVIDAAFITTPESLLLGLKLGRAAARATLMQRYEGFVEQVLVRIFNFTPQLPRLVERVLQRAIEEAEEFDPAGMTDRTIESWLLQLVVMTAQRHLRWRWFRRRPRATRLPGLSQQSAGEVTRFYRALDRLAPLPRIAFCLAYVAELDPEDVAGACNVSVAVLKRQLRRSAASVERWTAQSREQAKQRFRAA